MSTIVPVEVECAICKNTVEVFSLMSTSTFGASDLDFRPPPMRRNTMKTWFEVCSNCGYTNYTITKATPGAEEFIKTKRYIEYDGVKADAWIASDFIRLALMNEFNKNAYGEFDAYLSAAWCCDDYDDLSGAMECRNRCLSLYDKVLATLDDDVKDNFELQCVDILRRAKRFDELTEKFSDKVFGGESSEEKNKILVFQLMKAKESDDKVYDFSNVFDEE